MLSDYYPTGMSACDSIGMAGDCGMECPVYLDGECQSVEEFELEGLTDEELDVHWELYGGKPEDVIEMTDEEEYEYRLGL